MSITVESEVSLPRDPFSSCASQSLWIKSKLLNTADKPSTICPALRAPASFRSAPPSHPGRSQAPPPEFPVEAMLSSPLMSSPRCDSFPSLLTWQSPREALPRLDWRATVQGVTKSRTQLSNRARSTFVLPWHSYLHQIILSLFIPFFPLHSEDSGGQRLNLIHCGVPSARSRTWHTVGFPFIESKCEHILQDFPLK